MEYKTNELHFKYFKGRCEYWLEFLGLKSWKVYYGHADCEGNLADCSTDYAGRAATIRLSKKWQDLPPTGKLLNECALHECLEVMLSPLWGHATARIWDKGEYEQDHHAVIRVLEKVLIRKD